MSGKTGVFAGTFDPFTYGHMGIVTESLHSFDRIVIGILDNPDKNCMFDKLFRMNMIEKLFEEEQSVDVRSFDGMAVDFIRMVHGDAFIRGYRNGEDFEYEKKMRDYNLRYSGFDTVLIKLSCSYSDVSSTQVRTRISNGQDFSELVPERIKIMIDEYLHTHKSVIP